MAQRKVTPEKSALRQGLMVGAATAAYGISFGALAVASGLNLWQTVVLSVLMFTGGSQFALIGVLASGGTAAGPAAIASAALLGARNTAYGMRMKPVVGRGLFHNVAAGWLTIDESTAVSLAQSGARAKRIGFWATGIAVFVGWNIATLIGALIGDVLGDTRAYGLDAAAGAAFLALIWPRLTRLQPVAVACGAAVVAAALTPALAPGLPVILAAVVAVVVGIANWFSHAGSDAPATRPDADGGEA